MVSQQELQAVYSERRSVSVVEDAPKRFEKHRKGRPSVDVGLAQNYKERQDLPPVAQGVDPELQGAHEETSNRTEPEYVEILLHEEIKADQRTAQWQLDKRETKVREDEPPRDYVTGRILSEQGRSCLRCIEKGLRCTLNFVGKETEPRCAACRRSKAKHCVRFQPLGGGGRGIPFKGPPWKNPNFVAHTEDGAAAGLSREELEDILREHYLERKGCYVLGNYITEDDVHNYALPPFNGVDVPLADRPENYKTMDWKDVLPVMQNQSLRPRQAEGKGGKDGREAQKKKLAVARNQLLWPASPTDKEEAGEVERRNRLLMVGNGETRDEELSFLRTLRRYEPREQNLSDVLGETW
ncbi:hypothetical protein HD806DRAFT_542337 [Xylariaceae sp. AK1471]|nr:hypothetical protein HD806DRAFT_542337 [Xylariaceae sp. AK1471]